MMFVWFAMMYALGFWYGGKISRIIVLDDGGWVWGGVIIRSGGAMVAVQLNRMAVTVLRRAISIQSASYHRGAWIAAVVM